MALSGLYVPISLAASCESFVIQAGETVTASQCLDGNQTGVIQSGGSLETDNTAIYASGQNNAITINGSISTTWANADAIYSDGDNATISNSGSISTAGDHAEGIFNNDGDSATISNSGSISTIGLNALGIRSIDNNANISNSGSISTLGTTALGIFSYGNNVSITNGGSISTEGISAYGIYSEANPLDDIFTTISNSGSISTLGNNAYGIYTYVGATTITNSGSIETGGDSAYGIYSALGADVIIINSGSITTAGKNARGIDSRGANASITNSGSISTEGNSAYGINSVDTDTITNSGGISTLGVYAHGIYSRGENPTITNSGSISTEGLWANGVTLEGADATLTNSGLISVMDADSLAIYASASAGNLTLNLLPGSRILGAIDLGSAGDGDVANIYGTGGSAVLQILNAETINLHVPNAVLVGGDTVVIVEPTGESSRGAVLSGMTSSLHSIISQRMQSTRPFQSIKVAALELSPGMLHQERPPMAWGQVFGSKGKRDQDGQMLELDTRLRGVVGGYEQDYRQGHIGFLVGFAKGDAETDTLDQDHKSFFAGVYGHAYLGWANLTAAVIAGGESHDQDRLVQDNINGYETARSDTDSLFISPSVTLSRAYVLNPTTELRPSATLSYSYGRYDGYTETGTTRSNLKVDSRGVHALSARVQGEWVHMVNGGEIGVRAGLQARRTDDGPIRMSLGANAFRFDVMGDRNVAGGYVGLGANISLQKKLNLLADVEAGRMSGDETQLAGQLALQYTF
jgi:hypothetical protein